MPLFAPTHVLPSALSGYGSGVIDATQNLTVQWAVNGNVPMTAYQIVIYQNTAASTQMFTTGMVTLTTPFSGKDAEGNDTYFSATPITADQLATAGIVNGYSSGYKLIITQWWNASSSIAQPSASPFITRATPALSIAAYPNPIASNTYTFTGSYSQAQGDAINFVRWQFADATDTGNPIIDTGEMQTSVLSFSYDGLFSDTDYAIRLMVQTENGVNADTGWQTVHVSYVTRRIGGVVDVCQARSRSATAVSWTSVFSVLGVANGSYSISNGEVQLPQDSSIAWSEVNGDAMKFSYPWTFAWKGQCFNQGGIMWSMQIGTQTLSFSINSSQLTLTFGGTDIFTQAITGSIYGFWATIVTPTGIWVQRITDDGGLYPSDTLYPSDALYPLASTSTTVTTFNGAIVLGNGLIHGVTIFGQQICKYMWLENAILSAETIASIMASETYEPTWSDDTYMLANFTEDLNAGTLDTQGYSIYRETGVEPSYLHVCENPVTTRAMFDYGSPSQTPVTYSVFLQGQDVYINEPLFSQTYTPVFWDWSVLECTKDSNGIYHVLHEFIFSDNVSSGAMSNNNSPNIMQNFTPYPLIQQPSANYRSGTLNAYIGHVDTIKNKYIDDTELADSIYALSVSTNHKFLKDRKGNIWKIQTSAATTMQVGDLYREQPYAVSMQWAQVGSSDGVSIVSVPGDGSWPTDNIVQTSITIDPHTGELIWTIPDGYTGGSILSLDNEGNLIQTYTDWFTPATMTIETDGDLIATT
jgi:hypothetical protein